MEKNVALSATGGFGRQELPRQPLKFPEEAGDHSDANMGTHISSSKPKPAEEEEDEETSHGLKDTTPEESYDWDYESGDNVYPLDKYKVYVGCLPYSVDSEMLGRLFQAAGTVKMAKVVRNIKTYERTGESIGLGYVKYTDADDATKAMKMFNGYDWDGRIIRLFKDAPNVIYVGNLPPSVDDDRLQKFFCEHGEVLNARVMYDKGTGRSLGYGFVVMAPGLSEMNAAIVELDGQNLDGSAVAVNFSEESPIWRHFEFYEKEVETEEALWKLYKRWQRTFNIKRSEEDEKRRFDFFKVNAHVVNDDNKAHWPRQPAELGKFGDLDWVGEESFSHCGEEVDYSFRDDEGWSPEAKVDILELFNKLAEKQFVTKKKASVHDGGENRRPRLTELPPIKYGFG